MVGTYAPSTETIREFADETDAAALPLVSAIVPVYDDPAGIRRTVESLAASDYPRREIHAVYTPSTGETEAALEALADEVPDLSIHVEADHETPGAARNVGIDRAGGDVVLFVDADVTVADDFLWTIGYLFETTSVDYLGFPVEMEAGDDSSLAARYDGRVRFPVETFLRGLGFAPTCGLAVRASVFETGVRFNPSLLSAEDVVFGREVASLGHEVGFCPSVATRHPVRESLGEVVAKGVKTGWGWQEVDEQYATEYFHPRSRLLTLRGWLPPPPRYVAEKCRDWDSLAPHEKAGVYLFATVEEAARTWGYLRATLGDSAEEPPAVTREWYEEVGTVHE